LPFSIRCGPGIGLNPIPSGSRDLVEEEGLALLLASPLLLVLLERRLRIKSSEDSVITPSRKNQPWKYLDVRDTH
jgi:hypothetical protein